MLKKFAAAAVVVVLMGGVALAEEATGVLKKGGIDLEGKTIKLKVDDKDVTFTITSSTEFGSSRKGTFTAFKNEKAVKAAVERLNTAADEKEIKVKIEYKNEGGKKVAEKVILPGGRKKGAAE